MWEPVGISKKVTFSELLDIVPGSACRLLYSTSLDKSLPTLLFDYGLPEGSEFLSLAALLLVFPPTGADLLKK